MRMAEDDEDSSLQRAIQASLHDQSSIAANQLIDLSVGEEANTSPKTPPRPSIDDRIREISLQPALELPVINDPAGDTLVYIDPPAKQPEQDDIDYERYSKHYRIPMLVRRDLLLRYCAPNPVDSFNLATLYGPTSQHRIQRRRNLVAKLRKDPWVRYVIDLTPPFEGEDAVFLTTELCCSQSVRLWHRASDIWNLSSTLVGGRDEYASGERQNDRDTNSCNKSIKTRRMNKQGSTTSSMTSAGVHMPPEYTPLRHRSAIERVLAALMGVDPKLDSAPKVWSTFAVAKYLGLKNSPVTDYIIRWLRAYPNSFFLEVCPEVSIRIADGLENHDLGRDAFAILVGEEALESLVLGREGVGFNQHTLYGRRKEDLHEKMTTRIQYASKSLQERVQKDFEDLTGHEMDWIERLPEVRRLLASKQPKLEDIINSLIQLLKSYVRGSILKVLSVEYPRLPFPGFPRPGGQELIRQVDRIEVWKELSASARILTRSFWLTLRSSRLFEGSTNLHIRNEWATDCDNAEPARQSNPLADYLQEIEIVDLNDLINEGNKLHGDGTSKPMYTLPDRTRSPAIDNIEEGHTRRTQKLGNLSYGQLPFRETTPSHPIDVPRSTTRLHEFDSSNRHEGTIGNQAVPPDWPLGGEHRSFDEPDTESVVQFENPPTDDSEVTDWWDDVSTEDGTEAEAMYMNNNRNEQADQGGRSTPPFFRQPEESPSPDTSPPLDPQFSIWLPARTAFFDLYEFFQQAKASIETVARQKLQLADHQIRKEPHDIGITNTLVCLEDSEWKYLPLWAGGLDDDTGGVFVEMPPIDDLGPSTAGPEYHTGTTPANSDQAASEFEMVDSEYGTETLGTSMVTNQSATGAPDRKRVYAADSMESSSTNSFTMITPGGSSIECAAREQVASQEQFEAAEDAARTERLKNDTLMSVDENYADLFNDYNDDEDTERADDEDNSYMNDDWDDVNNISEGDDTVMV